MKTLFRICLAVSLAGLIFPFTPIAEAGKTDKQTEPSTEAPIASGRGEVVDLLRGWYGDGTAAGNMGDWYDNRDRGHSGLKMSRYPQLQRVTYTPQQLQRREDYGLQRIILPHVTVGNSSTSDRPERTGSLPRSYYTGSRGLSFLFTQYVRNNIYIYPEHRDYDPGHNGHGGYGDLYPANTPYLIISQGSSGSDKPFMHGVISMLAAFRPEVKERLVKTGMLMPTLQMILRITGKHVSAPGDYLTGKAHPTVFSRGNLDLPAMIKLAHEITLDSIPPIALLKVREEGEPIAGRDFFDPDVSEKLCDTPVVIARVFRGVGYRRKMTVSVSKNSDINHRPLTFHWAVLRGDPERVQIRKLSDDGSMAELTVSYHPRRPVQNGSEMTSNRVDIGVFTHNGAYYSPPSFITFFSIDSETRTYGDGGRILEVGYGAGSPYLKISDWPRLFELFRPEASSFSAKLLKKMFSSDQLGAIHTAAGEYSSSHAAEEIALTGRNAAREIRKETQRQLKEAQEALDAMVDLYERGVTDLAKADLIRAEAAVDSAKKNKKNADTEYREKSKRFNIARKASEKVLNEHRPVLKMSVKQAVDMVLTKISEDPGFLIRNTGAVERAYRAADRRRKRAFDKERSRLIATGVIAGIPGRAVKLRPALEGGDPASLRLTNYEKKMMHRLTASALAELLLPGAVKNTPTSDFVDWRIAAPKSWRDLYHYDDAGHMTGWTRYADKRVTHFNPDGLIVLKRDSGGRCIKAKKVRYLWDPPAVNPNGKKARFKIELLDFQSTGEVVHYEYEGPDDFKGRTP